MTKKRDLDGKPAAIGVGEAGEARLEAAHDAFLDGALPHWG